MGKRSVKENKNMYQLCREEQNLTREKASEQMIYVSADRIEKLESEKSAPHPDEILAMSECYKAPELINYYCSHECPIGKQYVPPVDSKDLSQIVLEILASLNTLEMAKKRFIEIAVDGTIQDDEVLDFTRIRQELFKLTSSVDALQLWLQKSVAEGKLDRKLFESILKA